MRAEIISVGTELLLGEIQDTNSHFLASRLPAMGIDLYYITVVGDNLERLKEVIGRAYGRSDLVLITGGLGPTDDDVTREAIAAVLGEEPQVDGALAQQLRQFFASRGISFPERNLKQAWLIPSAVPIPNPWGTAPGWWVEKEGRIIVAMPGPPAEMTRMWEEEVAPRLRQRGRGEVLVSRTLKTLGLGEGHVDELLGELTRSRNPTVAVYARADGIHVRLAAKASGVEEAQSLIAPLEEEVRRRLGPYIWGVDDEALEAVVGRLLREKGLTLAVMESFTGGLLADTITNVPGSSAYFLAGYVAYQPEAKAALGVDMELIRRHGVVSEEVAVAMARAARERAGAHIGVGTTGVAGPDALEGKPPGTSHIAVDYLGQVRTTSYRLYQGRLATKRRGVTAALGLLWRALQEVS
jgi:nicotinamide-nucleotide amidase